MKKTLLTLIIVMMLLPIGLGAEAISETYTCGHAAQDLSISSNADCYPAHSAEYILGDCLPYETLTRMKGCEMLLRAFGPLPDVQEGVRYLIKYRDCAFTDVPEEGRAAVENLTNAGLYIPENNEIFGPDESMMQADLAVLIDRIHEIGRAHV